MTAPVLQFPNTTLEQPAPPRSSSPVVYWIGLLLAAGADIGGFYGVVALALGSVTLPLGNLVVGVIVVGLTAVVLILAHALGSLLKARWLGRPASSRWHVGVLFVAWLLLGAITFAIRLHDPLASDQILLDGAAAAPAPYFDVELLPMGLLFLGLYVGSGVATAWVAFLHHGAPQRAPGAVRRSLTRRAAANQQTRTALRAADAAQYREVARRVTESETRLLQGAAETRDRLVDAQVQRGEHLKQYARVLMAQRGADPALTDALFRSERHDVPKEAQ